MHITHFRLHNFKSFQDLPDVEFGPGFNVIVGPNNAGKTALLSALSLNFANEPHRSETTMPRRTSPADGRSSVDLEVSIPRKEFLELVADHGPAHISHPGGETVPGASTRFTSTLPDPVSLNMNWQAGELVGADFPSWPVPSNSSHSFALHVIRGSTNLTLSAGGLQGTGLNDRFPFVLGRLLKRRIYLSNAERMNIGEAQIGTDPTLVANAANLPAVLHLLQTKNPSRFARYLHYVTSVFPEIRQITVPPIGSSVRILLWSTDPVAERDDLAIPLALSGTGVSQVLAILYAAVAEDFPRILLIDEPQSFLHPAALRKLIEILRMHPHQYIVTTHSPIVLSASNPSSVLLIAKNGPVSVTRTVDPREANDLRAVLGDIGARLSDVFGADNVLWVEGRTEELCFPVIWAAARTATDKVTATVVLGVRHTGAFSKRDATATIELYQRLTSASALMPPAIGFIFDPEKRTLTELQDLRRHSGHLIDFLPRRMFENYLLEPDALADVINSIEGFREVPVTPDEVSTYLTSHRWERQYVGRQVPDSDQTDALWAQEGDGAALLDRLFTELSDTRVKYDKPRHGLALTRVICDRQPARFEEIAALIRRAIAKAG